MSCQYRCTEHRRTSQEPTSELAPFDGVLAESRPADSGKRQGTLARHVVQCFISWDQLGMETWARSATLSITLYRAALGLTSYESGANSPAQRALVPDNQAVDEQSTMTVEDKDTFCSLEHFLRDEKSS